MDIDLSYGDLEAHSLDTVVPNHEIVRTFNVSGNNIPPDVFVDMVREHIVRMKKLEELDVKNNRIGPPGAQCLCKALIRHCPKLRYLDISENSILDESLVDVAYLLDQGCIETLLLVNSHITPRGVPTLCDGLLSSKCITNLSLAFNMLGDAGASLLARALGAHPTLRSLDISDNRIGDQGAIDIADYLFLSPYSRLESVFLSVNVIGDTGFSAIGEALSRTSNTRLSHLDLGCNANVGPEGRCAFIHYVEHMRHLYSLDLCSSNLSDEDMQALVHAVLSPTCGIGLIEWYNNPDARLSTEIELDAALKTKRSDREIRDMRTRRFCVAAASVFSVVALTYLGSVLLKRRRVAAR